LPQYSYTYKYLNRVLGSALHAYDMIQDGDRIVVGLSGGKDSWGLLWLLSERRRRVPVHYDLFPVHIDPGFEHGPAELIAQYSGQIGLAARIEHTDYGVLAHSPANRENPCFLCSRLRRQRLFEIAEELNCNKVALGHTKDDMIETLFLNLFYAGEMSTMLPCQPFFKGRFTVIRPLALADEEALIRFARQMKWPTAPNPCPSAGHSKRAQIKELLQQLYASNDKIKGNIFRAMRHVRPEYLPIPKKIEGAG
jgi:tRNA 2-thiocytidine biosynthesis protein TtcA